MGWRSELVERYTVTCRTCGREFIDPDKHPRRRWLAEPCQHCAHERAVESHRHGERAGMDSEAENAAISL